MPHLHSFTLSANTHIHARTHACKYARTQDGLRDSSPCNKWLRCVNQSHWSRVYHISRLRVNNVCKTSESQIPLLMSTCPSLSYNAMTLSSHFCEITMCIPILFRGSDWLAIGQQSQLLTAELFLWKAYSVCQQTLFQYLMNMFTSSWFQLSVHQVLIFFRIQTFRFFLYITAVEGKKF